MILTFITFFGISMFSFAISFLFFGFYFFFYKKQNLICMIFPVLYYWLAFFKIIPFVLQWYRINQFYSIFAYLPAALVPTLIFCWYAGFPFIVYAISIFIRLRKRYKIVTRIKGKEDGQMINGETSD